MKTVPVVGQRPSGLFRNRMHLLEVAGTLNTWLLVEQTNSTAQQ